MKIYELALPVFKQGDDLAHNLKSNQDNPIKALIDSGEQYRAAAEMCRKLAGACADNPITIRGDCHSIFVDGPENVLDQLVREGLLIVMEEDEETDRSPKPLPATSLSTNILIKSRGIIVGAIQSFSVTESSQVNGLIIGTCTRIRFDKFRISEIFSGETHIANGVALKKFDIEVVENDRTTTFKNCTIRNMGYSYNVESWVILENVEFVAESVSTT